MKNIPLLLGTLLITVLLVAGMAVMFSQSAEPQKADPAVVMGASRHIKGASTPKVTIVEFSDLECPACKAIQPMIASILAKYPNDVRLMYRHFPLVSIHPYAQLAAEASEAADSMGKFWEFHDLAFETQEQWHAMKSTGEVKDFFLNFAEKLQIDKSEFQKRIDSQEVKDRVREDMADAAKLNLSGTPTFFVNDTAVPAQDLAATVDALVAGQQ